MRFLNHNVRDPVQRSYVGDKKTYLEYEELLRKQEEKERLEHARSSRKKASAKVAALRKQLSSRASKHADNRSQTAEPCWNQHEAILEDDDELNMRTLPDLSDEAAALHGIRELDEHESQKKINLCVPIINTEDLNNYEHQVEVTFREVQGESQDKSLFQSQNNDLDLTTSGRYFGSRKSRSLVPQSKQPSVVKRLMEHQEVWGRTIDHFAQRRQTGDGSYLGSSLLQKQSNHRPWDLHESDSYLELEQIYSR